MFATAPTAAGCPFSGYAGTIYEKTAPMSNPVFAPGRGTPAIRTGPSSMLNDATTTKQDVTSATGIVVLASDDTVHRYWHLDEVLGAGPPPPPVAAFSADVTSGTAPLAVTFTDQSTGAPTSWSWTFGDGGTSTVQSPVHSYAAAGTYSVTLTATNAGGPNSLTKTAYITVNTAPPPPPPVAAFSANVTSGPAPLAVTFTDQSTGAPTAWSWTFGDGGTSTVQSPVHTYAAAGTYSVTLTASNAGGPNSLTKTNYITVNPAPPPPPPVAAFSADVTSGTAPLAVTFSDQSTGVPTSWSWTFGDGATSTVQSPLHSYAAAGTYSVTLTATNAGGPNSLTKTNYITVNPAPPPPPPVAAFNADVTSAGLQRSVDRRPDELELDLRSATGASRDLTATRRATACQDQLHHGQPGPATGLPERGPG